MYKLTRKYKTDRIPKVEKLLDSLSTQVCDLNPKGTNKTGLIFEATGQYIHQITQSVNHAIEISLNKIWK
jgi:hypothetical protein